MSQEDEIEFLDVMCECGHERHRHCLDEDEEYGSHCVYAPNDFGGVCYDCDCGQFITDTKTDNK